MKIKVPGVLSCSIFKHAIVPACLNPLIPGYIGRPNTEIRMTSKIPLIVVALGAILLGFMIVFEDEPGAIPLIMIAGGLIWYFVERRINKA